MLSQKIEIYNKSCVWLKGCIGIFWPIIMFENLSVIVYGFYIDSWLSLALIIPNAINFVLLLAAEILIREGDDISYKFWYVGHLSTVFTSLLSLILFIALGAISTTNSINAAASDTSIFGILSSTMDISSQLAISSFGSAISFTLLIDYIAICIPSIIYIRKRRDLFQYSYKKLRSHIAKMYDDE